MRCSGGRAAPSRRAAWASGCSAARARSRRAAATSAASSPPGRGWRSPTCSSALCPAWAPLPMASRATATSAAGARLPPASRYRASRCDRPRGARSRSAPPTRPRRRASRPGTAPRRRTWRRCGRGCASRASSSRSPLSTACGARRRGRASTSATTPPSTSTSARRRTRPTRSAAPVAWGRTRSPSSTPRCACGARAGCVWWTRRCCPPCPAASSARRRLPSPSAPPASFWARGRRARPKRRPSGVKSTRIRSGRPERRGECARLRERSTSPSAGIACGITACGSSALPNEPTISQMEVMRALRRLLMAWRECMLLYSKVPLDRMHGS
mmetsp:Transcript_32023/g.102471  ORF Transcript_32023/g.102471 Transcript_32023/m.102471 type:complete len:328 (+) Transcript_32023:391-1374(+)